MAISKTLRGYQADLYRRVNRARNNGKDAVMLLPTGAGKTAIVVTLRMIQARVTSTWLGVA